MLNKTIRGGVLSEYQHVAVFRESADGGEK